MLRGTVVRRQRVTGVTVTRVFLRQEEVRV